MEVTFGDLALRRLETEASFSAGFNDAIVKAYRKRIQQIRAASDERTFFAYRSLHFEKLLGDRSGQHSMRLNNQWRLILELRGRGAEKIVHIVAIVDYH